MVDILTDYYNGKEGTDGDGAIDNANEADTATTSSSWVMTNNRAIILSGVFANLIAVFVAFTVREIKVDANAKQKPMTNSTSISSHDNDECPPLLGSRTVNNSSAPNISQFQPVKGSSYQILLETMKTPNFRRFLVVCLLTINVRMIFRHM